MTSEEMKVYQQRYADHGLGLACGFHTVCIDIDADEESLSRDLTSAAEEIFLKTPLVRVGKEPHVNLVYACSEPIMAFGLPKLEVLGVGRYLAAYGDHPFTGYPYKWVRGHSPIDTPAWVLPKITQRDVDRYIKTVSSILGINYDDIVFDIGQEHMERMLSSRTQLTMQLALAVLRGKPAAKRRARKMLADGVLCVPTFKLRRSVKS
jgi:hypothetical protein